MNHERINAAVRQFAKSSRAALIAGHDRRTTLSDFIERLRADPAWRADELALVRAACDEMLQNAFRMAGSGGIQFPRPGKQPG
jgi:hypothetical protein